MYNGIGLRTAKGSATSGHIQRNVAYVKPEFFRSNLSSNRAAVSPRGRGERDYETSRSSVNHKAKVNSDILEHNRKRAIEGKVFELAENLRATGKYGDDEIESRCDGMRKTLQAEQARGPDRDFVDGQRGRRSGSRSRSRDRDGGGRRGFGGRSRSRSRDRDSDRYLVDNRRDDRNRGVARPRGGRFERENNSHDGGHRRGNNWRNIREVEAEQTNTHEREKKKATQNERMRKAFGIRGTFKEGDAFDEEAQERIRGEEAAEREERRLVAARRREERELAIRRKGEQQEQLVSRDSVSVEEQPKLISWIMPRANAKPFAEEEEGEECEEDKCEEDKEPEEKGEEEEVPVVVADAAAASPSGGGGQASDSDEPRRRRRHDSDSDC